MTQRFSLYEDLTRLREPALLRRASTACRGEQRRARVDEVLDAHRPAATARGQLAGTLSGGWKQRVALACATIHEPPLLFLDEPTAGVDPVSRREFWEQIHQLAARGHHRARHDALHGRGRALPPPRVHLPRRGARRRHAPRRSWRAAACASPSWRSTTPRAAADAPARAAARSTRSAHYGHALRVATLRGADPERSWRARALRAARARRREPRARHRRGRVRVDGARTTSAQAHEARCSRALVVDRAARSCCSSGATA